MRGGAILETVLGLIVLIAAGAFFIYAQGQVDDGSGADGYKLTARFSSVGDLTRGADVRVAGVPVGTVTAVRLDQETYFAEAELELSGHIEIPTDSTAKSRRPVFWAVPSSRSSRAATWMFWPRVVRFPTRRAQWTCLTSLVRR